MIKRLPWIDALSIRYPYISVNMVSIGDSTLQMSAGGLGACSCVCMEEIMRFYHCWLDIT